MDSQYPLAVTGAIPGALHRLHDDSLRIASASFNSASEVSVAEEIVTLICETLRVPMSSVWVCDTQTNSVRLLFEGGGDMLFKSGDADKALVEETVLDVLHCSVSKTESSSSGSDEKPSPSDTSGTGSTAFQVPESKSTRLAILAIPLHRAIGASIVICACAPNPYQFSEVDRVLLLMIASRAGDALDLVEANMRVRTSHQQLLTIAEMANPGLVATSFVHDARHTLHTINALVSSLMYLIPRDMHSTPPAREILDSLTTHSRYLAELFDSLQRIARSRSQRSHLVSVGALLTHISSLFQLRLRSIELELPHSMMDEKFECYPEEIEQVFINLIQNSINAIRSAGRKRGAIKIEVRLPNPEKIAIILKDNGIGIAEEHMESIFEPSFTTMKGSGSGFGLSICKRIVEHNHNGRILIRSQQGEFTEVTVLLPRKLVR